MTVPSQEVMGGVSASPELTATLLVARQGGDLFEALTDAIDRGAKTAVILQVLLERGDAVLSNDDIQLLILQGILSSHQHFERRTMAYNGVQMAYNGVQGSSCPSARGPSEARRGTTARTSRNARAPSRSPGASCFQSASIPRSIRTL